MDLNNLDPEVRAVFSKAYATFRERITMEPALATRAPYVGPKHNLPPPPIVKELTVDSAFELLIKARARQKRNEKPATREHIHNVWLDYRHQFYQSPKWPLPVDELFETGLSALLIRDVFLDVQRYRGRLQHERGDPAKRKTGKLQTLKEILEDATTPTPPPLDTNPFALLLETARRLQKKCDNIPFEIRRAERHLRQNGFVTIPQDIDTLRNLRQNAHNCSTYPRTYL